MVQEPPKPMVQEVNSGISENKLKQDITDLQKTFKGELASMRQVIKQ